MCFYYQRYKQMCSTDSGVYVYEMNEYIKAIVSDSFEPVYLITNCFPFDTSLATLNFISDVIFGVILNGDDLRRSGYVTEDSRMENVADNLIK